MDDHTPQISEQETSIAYIFCESSAKVDPEPPCNGSGFLCAVQKLLPIICRWSPLSFPLSSVQFRSASKSLLTRPSFPCFLYCFDYCHSRWYVLLVGRDLRRTNLLLKMSVDRTSSTPSRALATFDTSAVNMAIIETRQFLKFDGHESAFVPKPLGLQSSAK